MRSILAGELSAIFEQVEEQGFFLNFGSCRLGNLLPKVSQILVCLGRVVFCC